MTAFKTVRAGQVGSAVTAAVDNPEQPVAEPPNPEPPPEPQKAAPEPHVPQTTDIPPQTAVEAVMSGQAALVPLEWLQTMLTKGQTTTIVQRRRARRTAAERPEPAAKTKRAFGVKIAGLYKLSGKSRETVRGRETIKKVFAFLKDHPNGVTAKQIQHALKMPSSTVQYTLGRLQEKQAVSYTRGA